MSESNILEFTQSLMAKGDFEAAENALRARLRAGESFSSALAADEVSVPDFLLQLARAGEQTGKLGQALESAAQQMEYEERVRQEMKSALIYPVILVISGISATLLVFIVVVPKFANIL